MAGGLDGILVHVPFMAHLRVLQQNGIKDYKAAEQAGWCRITTSLNWIEIDEEIDSLTKQQKDTILELISESKKNVKATMLVNGTPVLFQQISEVEDALERNKLPTFDPIYGI